MYYLLTLNKIRYEYIPVWYNLIKWIYKIPTFWNSLPEYIISTLINHECPTIQSRMELNFPTRRQHTLQTKISFDHPVHRIKTHLRQYISLQGHTRQFHFNMKEMLSTLTYVGVIMSSSMNSVNLFWGCFFFPVSTEDDNYLSKVLTTPELPITKSGNYVLSYV